MAWGTDFNGLTSFDKDSSTESISQDGYTGGTLNDLKIDETGTIIGAFTNGQSFGLAQVALASFTNNEGLQSEGGNVFSQTATQAKQSSAQQAQAIKERSQLQN